MSPRKDFPNEKDEEMIEALSKVAEKSRGFRCSIYGLCGAIAAPIVATAANLVCYAMFLSEHGASFFSFLDFELWWRYQSSPLGITFACLAIGPLVLAWLAIQWVTRNLDDE